MQLATISQRMLAKLFTKQMFDMIQSVPLILVARTCNQSHIFRCDCESKLVAYSYQRRPSIEGRRTKMISKLNTTPITPCSPLGVARLRCHNFLPKSSNDSESLGSSARGKSCFCLRPHENPTCTVTLHSQIRASSILPSELSSGTK